MSARLTVILATTVAVLLIVIGLYWKGRQDGAAREQPKVEAALARAETAILETDGARSSARRVDVAARQREDVARIATDLTTQAVQAEDANDPLEETRAARLRAADRRLCDAAPDLCTADRNAR